MGKKPTYEELEQRVKELENEAFERKKAEEALRESEEKYRSIFSSATDTFLIFDYDGNIVEANPQAREMYGYSHEELVGLSGKDIVHPDYYNLFEKFKKDVREIGEFYAESVDVRKDGSSFSIEVRGGAFLYKGKHHLLAVIRDISERKREEDRIEGLNRLKEDLLGSGSLAEKIKRITDGVVDILGADFARIWLTNQGDMCDSGCMHAKVSEGPHVCRERNRCLHLVASSGLYTHIDGAHRRVPFGCYKIGRVAASEEPGFLTNDVTHDLRVHNHEWAR